MANSRFDTGGQKRYTVSSTLGRVYWQAIMFFHQGRKLNTRTPSARVSGLPSLPRVQSLRGLICVLEAGD